MEGLTFQFAAKSNSKNSECQFWQIGNHPEEIFTEKFGWSKLNRAANRYIQMNPLRSSIVTKAPDYLYSSASNYVGRKNLLNDRLADNPTINPVKSSGFDVDINLL